jgi:dUTP pyrophosphatase
MSEITLKEIEVQKLNLGPNDFLVVKVGESEDFDASYLDSLRKGLSQLDVKGIIVKSGGENGIDFSVVKQSKNLKVKFKKLHEDAVLPSYAKYGDAGMDITATSDPIQVHSESGKESWFYMEYKTGLAVEIPEGYVGLMFPRSSISKSSLLLANCVGVCDSGFRGEICFRFKTDGSLGDFSRRAVYNKGDRIGQLVILPYPTVEAEFVDELSTSERGSGGWGSTGV